MKIIIPTPWFEIYISEFSDGNFRDSTIHPEILRPHEQLHSTHIHALTRENRDIPFTWVDWVYTKEKDVIIGALCADCPVIILMGDGECAILHSGWRGTRSHIVHAGIALLETPRDNIKVYIWPHISKESYEVRSDFFSFFPKEYFETRWERTTFDLEKYIIDDMISVWIRKEHITTSPIDTCTNQDYHSYRRDPKSGVWCVGVKMI